MTEFLVIWKIDIDGEDPVDAAREALEIQRDTESIATVFEVIDKEKIKKYTVDLLEKGNPITDIVDITEWYQNEIVKKVLDFPEQ